MPQSFDDRQLTVERTESELRKSGISDFIFLYRCVIDRTSLMISLGGMEPEGRAPSFNTCVIDKCSDG